MREAFAAITNHLACPKCQGDGGHNLRADAKKAGTEDALPPCWAHPIPGSGPFTLGAVWPSMVRLP